MQVVKHSVVNRECKGGSRDQSVVTWQRMMEQSDLKMLESEIWNRQACNSQCDILEALI